MTSTDKPRMENGVAVRPADVSNGDVLRLPTSHNGRNSNSDVIQSPTSHHDEDSIGDILLSPMSQHNGDSNGDVLRSPMSHHDGDSSISDVVTEHHSLITEDVVTERTSGDSTMMSKTPEDDDVTEQTPSLNDDAGRDLRTKRVKQAMLVPLNVNHVDTCVQMTRSDPALCGLRELRHTVVPLKYGIPSCASSYSERLAERRILLEEVAPSGSSVIDGTAPKQDGRPKAEWQMSLERFSSMKHGKTKSYHKLPRRVRRYYKAQDELISAFEDMQLELDDAVEIGGEQALVLRRTSLLSLITFLTNLVLLIAKTMAAILSGSLAVVSSVIDSAMDLISGALIYWSARAVKHRNIYEYPQGRTKIEPVAIVVLSVIMALASVQMTIESVEKIIAFAKGTGKGPVFGIVTICICVSTIVVKFILYLVCRRHNTPGVQTLALDHRNDVLSNSVALTCGLIGYELWKYADPIGAILISVYIIVSWFIAGWAQIKMLTGYTARPDFLKKLTWACVNHHPAILFIDTVRAFHFGCNFIVEVDIVLPERMRVRQAHDIAETLQRKLEHMEGVERAFVHIDYEWEHMPADEHKVV